MQYNLSVEKQVGTNWLLSCNLPRKSAAPPVGKQRSQSGYARDRAPLATRSRMASRALRTAAKFLTGHVPGFLPPAFCAGPGTALSAKPNASARYGSGMCSTERLPATERPCFWSSREQETTTVCSSRPSTILPIISPRLQITRGPTASRTTTQRHSASSLRRNPGHMIGRLIAAIVRMPTLITSSTNPSWRRLPSFRITLQTCSSATGDSPLSGIVQSGTGFVSPIMLARFLGEVATG